MVMTDLVAPTPTVAPGHPGANGKAAVATEQQGVNSPTQ